jgi:hypothetical protein
VTFAFFRDAELQRRQVEDPGRGGARLAQERLRQIERDMDEASRVLRRARTQVQLARDQLDEFKDRHWALLSFYNPDQAEEKVREALDELQQLEPAARLDDFLNTQKSTVDKVEAFQATIEADIPISSDDATPSS